MALISDIQNSFWQTSATTPSEIVQGLADVQQCIRTILFTQKGTAVLVPDFGIDLLAYIDRPINETKAALRREILEQMERYEPRAEIERITFEVSGSQLLITVYWTADNSALQSTQVPLNVVS